MKRRLLHILPIFTALLLCVGIGLGTLFSASSATNEKDRWSYAMSGNVSGAALSASALFEKVFGVAPLASEAIYLDQLSGITLKYNGTQAELAPMVSTDYRKNDGALVVSVTPYSYTAVNGAEVTWIPQDVSITTEEGTLRQALQKTDAAYTCTLAGLYHSGDFELEVTFAWSEELPKELAEELLNAAYGVGSGTLEIILADEARAAQYQTALNAYNAYQAYLAQKKAYENYVSAHAQYQNVALPAYQSYQSSLARYQADLQAFEAWELYYETLKQYENPEDLAKAFEAYQAYLSKMDKIEKKLQILEVLFLEDSHGWELYGSLMGGSVTAALLGNKAELDAAGFKPQVKASEEATVALRTLMQGYSDLRDAEYASEHDKTVALYTYYIANYTALRDQFMKLSGALYEFLLSPSVCIGIKEKGGAERFAHYEQFVALLYTTGTALDDRVTRPSAWGYGKNYTTLLDAELLIADSVATPSQSELPEAEVPAVQVGAAPEVANPGRKPILNQYLTDEVKGYLAQNGASSLDVEPTEPQKVENPDLGVIPPVAEHPGDAPMPTTLDARLVALAQDVRAGKLQKRSLEDYSTMLHLQKTVEHLVSIDNKKVVTFYAHDRQTVLDRQVLEYGSEIFYAGDRAVFDNWSSVSHNYQFRYWAASDGKPAQMMAYSDLSLYAHYFEAVRFYTVTWVLDGVEKTQSYAYGETPIAPFETQKPADVAYEYSFSGWQSNTADEAGIHAVTGDVTYTGSITKTPRTYTVTWVLGERTVEESYEYGDFPAYTGDLERAPDRYCYTFLRWDQTLDWVRGDVTYTAIWEKTALATTIDGDVQEVLHTDKSIVVLADADKIDIREASKLADLLEKDLVVIWDQFSMTIPHTELAALNASGCRRIHLTEHYAETFGTVYRFGYFNSAGREQELTVSAMLQAIPDANGVVAVGFLAEADGWRLVGEDAVEVTGGARFRISRSYGINVSPVEKCNLSELPLMSAAGTRVNLKLNCVFGYEISAARVTMSDGTEVALDGLSFIMPQGEVTVELTVTQIVYHVTFVADGVVLSEADYLLGDKIVMPANPTKGSDGVYDYAFVGWSKEAMIAYGDDRNPIYEAVFSATPIVIQEHRLSRIDIIVTIILPIVGIVLVLGMIAFGVWYLVKKKKHATVTVKECSDEPAEKVTEETEPRETTAEPSESTETQE